MIVLNDFAQGHAERINPNFLASNSISISLSLSLPLSPSLSLSYTLTALMVTLQSFLPPPDDLAPVLGDCKHLSLSSHNYAAISGQRWFFSSEALKS